MVMKTIMMMMNEVDDDDQMKISLQSKTSIIDATNAHI